jgi:hypothetical protein
LIPFPVVLGTLVYFVISFYPESSRLPKSLIFNPPFPYSSLHTFFVFFSTLLVAYFFARSFLSSGALNLITLGTGSLILGLGFAVGSILGNHPYGGSGQLLTISNITFLVTGILFGTFATFSLLNRTPSLGKRRGVVVASYLGGILIVVLIAAVAETKVASDFYTIATGPTLFRDEVLGAAVVLFAYSSIVLLKDYFASRATVLFWFSLGLGSMALGYCCALLGTFPGGPLSWLARITIALGGVYFLVAVLTTFRKIRMEKQVVLLEEEKVASENEPVPVITGVSISAGKSADSARKTSGTGMCPSVAPQSRYERTSLMFADRHVECV